MQPAQEVIPFPKEGIILPKYHLIFDHAKTSMMSVGTGRRRPHFVEQDKGWRETICLNNPAVHRGIYYTTEFETRDGEIVIVRKETSVISTGLFQEILLMLKIGFYLNLIKGTLKDAHGIIGKFHIAKLYTSKELFSIRFDRDKVKTDLKKWLWEKIRDLYDAWDCDDPRKDPLDGKREALWHEALPLFRVYNQSTYYVNQLPELSSE